MLILISPRLRRGAPRRGEALQRSSRDVSDWPLRMAKDARQPPIFASAIFRRCCHSFF